MNLPIQQIAIIGLGNVGTQLAHIFHALNLPLTQIYSRNLEQAKQVANQLQVTPVDNLTKISTDLCIVCVSDDAINAVVNQISSEVKIAYTSGNVGLQSLDRKHKIGVLYPLQSFSKGRTINLQEVPFLIESNHVDLAQELFDLAQKISTSVQFMSSEKRREVHLAAVFINNFINHQIYIAEQIAAKFQFDKKLLYPLLTETIEKAMENGAFISQTGPARRNNKSVMQAQEAMLEGTQKEIYQLITKNITQTYYD